MMSPRVGRSGIAPALPLLAPAYLWLTVAIFLPLSAMAFFSFMTDLPMTGRDWSFTLRNYAAFFSTPLYSTLLWASLRLGIDVTLWCVVIGFPAAYVLAKVLKGRAREATSEEKTSAARHWPSAIRPAARSSAVRKLRQVALTSWAAAAPSAKPSRRMTSGAVAGRG